VVIRAKLPKGTRRKLPDALLTDRVCGTHGVLYMYRAIGIKRAVLQGPSWLTLAATTSDVNLAIVG